MITEHDLARGLEIWWPAAANHIWQSTCFATGMGALTLLFRRNQAFIRYRIWMMASVKFLVPFSLLTGMASFVPVMQPAIGSRITIYTAIDVAARPFLDVGQGHNSAAKDESGFIRSGRDSLLAAGAFVWLAGFAMVMLIWARRWRIVAGLVRRSERVQSGRELELLAGSAIFRSRKALPALLATRELMEPGVFGIFRQVLVWPKGLSATLNDHHIEAILTHEMVHMERRDNLTAAIHMLVEAIFWFHPMVWWIERRLVEERERACDERVVQLDGKPDVYAEGLLKACRFCVESPLVCVAGISGADLNERIWRIMRGRKMHPLRAGGKVLITLAALLIAAAPIVFGQVSNSLHLSLPAAPRPPLPPPPPPPKPGDAIFSDGAFSRIEPVEMQKRDSQAPGSEPAKAETKAQAPLRIR